jgi:hypothetical protein
MGSTRLPYRNPHGLEHGLRDHPNSIQYRERRVPQLGKWLYFQGSVGETDEPHV